MLSTKTSVGSCRPYFAFAEKYIPVHQIPKDAKHSVFFQTIPGKVSCPPRRKCTLCISGMQHEQQQVSKGIQKGTCRQSWSVQVWLAYNLYT